MHYLCSNSESKHILYLPLIICKCPLPFPSASLYPFPLPPRPNTPFSRLVFPFHYGTHTTISLFVASSRFHHFQRYKLYNTVTTTNLTYGNLTYSLGLHQSDETHNQIIADKHVVDLLFVLNTYVLDVL